MQEYDESFFRAKANKRARLTWLILLVIITVYYGVKIPSGDVEFSRFLAFTITGWLLYIIGAVYLIIRGNDSNDDSLQRSEVYKVYDVDDFVCSYI